MIHGPHGIEVTRHDVQLDTLPNELSGTTIAQISDLHRGGGVRDSLLRAAVDAVNALEADYAVVTGDFVNERARDIEPVVKIVSHLRAKRGVLGSLGNHDHRGDPDHLLRSLNAAGIRMLNNASAEMHPGFWMAGLDDLHEGKPDIEATFRDLPDDAALVLLAHHPWALEKVPDRPMLILSGHTHGGQIRVRFPSPETVCKYHLRVKHVHGWFKRGQVQMYVNRGIGVTGPILINRRYNCPP